MMNPPILNPTRPINPLPTTANKTSGTPPPPSPYHHHHHHHHHHHPPKSANLGKVHLPLYEGYEGMSLVERVTNRPKKAKPFHNT